MHAADRAAQFIEGDAALRDPRIQAVIGKFFVGPGPREESAFVFNQLRLYDKSAFQRCFSKYHFLPDVGAAEQFPAPRPPSTQESG